MKKMTLGNRILAMLLAFVMILTGIAPGTFNARVVKAADATEQRFNRIYREDGIVQVINSIYQNSDSILTPKETSHRIKARKAGEVTDNSQVSDKVDIDQIVKEGITSASTFLNSQNYKYECSGASDWYIMSTLRTDDQRCRKRSIRSECCFCCFKMESKPETDRYRKSGIDSVCYGQRYHECRRCKSCSNAVQQRQTGRRFKRTELDTDRIGCNLSENSCRCKMEQRIHDRCTAWIPE